MSQKPKLAVVGYKASFHLGAHFYRAAQQMDLSVEVIDPSAAFNSSWLTRQINWRLRNHRPPRLHTFNEHIQEFCYRFEPDILLVLGLAPVTAHTLSMCRSNGIICCNFLTDDPWNPSHYSSRHIHALPQYDLVFTPRYSNIPDLQKLGCHTRYMPFGYEPTLHFPESPPEGERGKYACDVMFYGGADRDRVPIINELLRSQFKVDLYGGYWERFTETRRFSKGLIHGQQLRFAVSEAAVSLCMVRRANRDGHVMRSYEIPAMGGCMIVDDTDEHRMIFGADNQRVVYFSSTKDLISSINRILADSQLREGLAKSVHNHITGSANTYYDRLVHIIADCNAI